jgi:hypothetical protein
MMISGHMPTARAASHRQRASPDSGPARPLQPIPATQYKSPANAGFLRSLVDRHREVGGDRTPRGATMIIE